MKKTSLYSLAALLAAVCLPAGSLSQNVHASLPDSRTALLDVEIDPATLSADQFIERFCGTTLQRVCADGTTVSEFIWYTSITEENCSVIAQGKAVFDQMSVEKQNIIVQAARAFNIDYPAFAQRAIELTAPAPVPAPEETPGTPAQNPAEQTSTDNSADDQDQADDSANTQDSQQPSSDKPADNASEPNDPADTGAGENDAKPETPGDAVSSDAPEETPGTPADAAGDQQPDADVQQPVQTPDDPADGSSAAQPEEGAAEEVKQPEYSYGGGNLNLLPANKPKGLTCTELFDAEVDQQTYAVAAALAQGAGWPQHMVIPVYYTFTNEDFSISSQMFYRISIGELMILFDYSANEDGTVSITIYTDGSCSFDANTGVLSLPAIGQASLNPVAQSAQEEESAGQPIENTTIVPVNDTEIFYEVAGAKTGNESIAHENAPTGQQTARLSDLNAEVEADARLSVINAPITRQMDAQAADFVARYVMQNGAVIKSINASNYQQVLNGMKAWNAMSTTQRRAVNDHLIASGSTRYQILYKQANEYRLGMPLHQNNPTGGQYGGSSSVNTAAEENLLLYAGSFVLSAQGALAIAGKELYDRRRAKKGENRD